MLAAGLVKNIQQGCDLYKQAKESFVEIKKTANEAVGIYKEVTGFWSNFSKFFKPKVNHEQPIAKPKKSTYVSVDETQVKVDIVQNLTKGLRNEHLLHSGIVIPVSFAGGLSRFLPLPLPKP